MYPDLPSKKKSNKIGVNIAFDRYERRYGKNIYTILDQIALGMKKIQEEGYEIIHVCHLENDSKFEISLLRRGVKFQTINLQYKLPKEVYNFYNDIELMFGTRGHAQMIPFGLNTKIISLGTHEKLKYFLEDVNSMDWYIDVQHHPNRVSDQIKEKFDLLINLNRSEVESRLKKEQDILYGQTKSNLAEIEQILNSYS